MAPEAELAARVDAQRRVYWLIPEPLVEINDWVTPFREARVRKLDALEAHLDAEAHGRQGPDH
jgi:hypothetical protein